MKPILALVACLLVSDGLFAQNAAQPVGRSKVRKNAVGGIITDLRNNPLPKVQIYIYKGDSATNASGYTDARGNFETNNVMPGVYDLRVVYPSSTRIVISGVPVKMHKVTYFKLAANAPTADSTVAFTDLVPAAIKK